MATAVGDIKSSPGVRKSLCLMAAQGAATTPPAAATDGLPAYPVDSNYGADTGAYFSRNAGYRHVLSIHNSAGSGSLTGLFTLYGYIAATGVWFPIPLKAGAAIAGTNVVRYTETILYNLAAFDRLMLDVQSPGGTGQQFEGWIHTMLENS